MKNKTTLKFSPVHISLAVLFLVSAFITVLPAGFSAQVNFLGFESFCSYAPVSTALLFITGTLFLNKALIFKSLPVKW